MLRSYRGRSSQSRGSKGGAADLAVLRRIGRRGRSAPSVSEDGGSAAAGAGSRRSRGGGWRTRKTVCVARAWFVSFHRLPSGRPAAENCHTPLIPWGRTDTAAGPDAAVIQRPFLPGPWFQGRGGRPGCAETDRAQGPQRALCVRRRWFGGGGGGVPAKPWWGLENAKNGVCSGLVSGWVREGGRIENDQVVLVCWSGAEPWLRPADQMLLLSLCLSARLLIHMLE